jgi:hypothetical protein
MREREFRSLVLLILLIMSQAVALRDPPMDDGSMQVLLSTFKVRRYISRFQIVALKQDNQNQASRSKRIMKEEKFIR